MTNRSLEILKPNHAGAFIRKDANPNTPATNYGVIEKYGVHDVLIYWTRVWLSYRLSK